MDASAAEASEARYQALLRLATRLFYDLGEVLVMETLIHAPRQTPPDGGPSRPEWQLDDAIAERLNIHPKQVRGLLARLLADRLVVQDRRCTTRWFRISSANGMDGKARRVQDG